MLHTTLLTPQKDAAEDPSPALNGQVSTEGHLHYEGTNLGETSVSETDVDTNNTDDENGVRVFPVSSALTNETVNTTQAVSAGRSTTRGRLSHGSDKLLKKNLGSDGTRSTTKTKQRATPHTVLLKTRMKVRSAMIAKKKKKTPRAMPVTRQPRRLRSSVSCLLSTVFLRLRWAYFVI